MRSEKDDDDVDDDTEENKKNTEDFKPKFIQAHKKDKQGDGEKPLKSVFQSSHGAKAHVMKTFDFGKSPDTSKNSASEKKSVLSNSTESKPSKPSIAFNYYEDEEDEED